MNICDYIANNAAHLPHVAAMEEGERTITYRELDALVGRTAAHLCELGVGVGTHVGLRLKDTADHFVAMLAVWRLGAVSVTLDWRAPAREYDRMVSMFDVEFIVAERPVNALPGVRSAVLDDTWHDAVATRGATGDFPHDGSLPMLIATTSGTTGEPKGAVFTHDQFFARFISTWWAFGWEQGERYLSCLPLQFMFGRENVLFQLIGGSTVIFFPTLFNAKELVDGIVRTRATTCGIVPTVLRWLLELPAENGPLFPDMRLLVVTGALVHEEEKRAATARLTPNFGEAYGNTYMGSTTFLKAEDMAHKAHTVGRSTPLFELQIVDNRDRPLAAGETGILRGRGPSLPSGAYGAATGRDKVDEFRDGWYYSGDLASLDEYGFLSIRGRISDVIIRGGANIVSGEVEAVLLSHPAIVEAAVIGWPSPVYGEEVAAFIVVNAAVSAADIQTHCRTRLASHKIPREVFLRDGLPKGRTGKILKIDLAAGLPPLDSP